MNTGLTQVLSDGTNTYLYGNGRIAQANSTTEYFIADALGSVRQLVDINSVVTLTQSYAPYGTVTQSVGNGATTYQFTGEMRDANGLIYLRARYYNPTDGRFLSRDTWGGSSTMPMTYNRWVYANENPVMFTDPSGLCVDQTGTPRRCVAEFGDWIYQIARTHGVLPSSVISWNKTAYGNDWNEHLIHPGDIIYLEDPFINNVPPIPNHSGQMLNGYIEGQGFSASAFFLKLEVRGEEVVYDFETLQRAKFTYHGDKIFAGLFCGFSTDLWNVGTSYYSGFFHFPPDEKIDSYAGRAAALGAGIGITENPLSGLLGAFGLGVEATASISAGGKEILGIPTATDYEHYGVTVSPIGLGVSVPRLPIGINFVYLQYNAVEIEQYFSAEEMRKDILAGKGAVINPNMMFQTVSRLYFAEELRKMYSP